MSVFSLVNSSDNSKFESFCLQYIMQLPPVWSNTTAARSSDTAVLASLTSTCRRHEIDPQLYLTQLLMNLPQTRMSELPSWLPDQWKLRHATRLAGLEDKVSPVANL